MRTLKKCDIESMEKELQVLKNPESVLGGAGDNPPYPGYGVNDCFLQTISYVTGGQYSPSQVRDSYIQEVCKETWGTSTPDADQLSAAEGYVSTHGVGDGMAKRVYQNFLGDCNVYNDVCNTYSSAGSSGSYIKTQIDSGSTNVNGMVASFEYVADSTTGATTNHTVAVKEYNSGTFTYWDQQNNCSGTFTWSQLFQLITPKSGSVQ